MADENFPTLKPAFTLLAIILPALPVGTLNLGPSLSVIPITGGTLTSQSSYPISVTGTIIEGSDYISGDPAGQTLRLDVRAVIRDEPTQALIRFNYTGIIRVNAEIGKVLTGARDAETVAFGGIASHATFSSGDPRFAELDKKLYVGSGRFVLEEGKDTVVEYKLSEVIP